ncbi:MAG: hypothetical protein ACFFBJ_11970 [Promethearchaeota archaeon]
MSEVPNCPYCGAPVHTDKMMDYDNKIKLRCNNCGGYFEFMPGFGAFSLPKNERGGRVRQEGSAFRPHYEVYESDTPYGFEQDQVQQSGGGGCCGVLLCLCCVLPILLFIFSLILGFGWLWSWF